MRAMLVAALHALLVLPCVAQTQSRTAQSAAIWASVFADHRIAPKTALYWDASSRRVDGGASWQQNIGSIGLTRDLPKRWRATAALGGAYGYRYGDFPTPTNTIELRPWLQLSGARPVGSWAWSDRVRAEFRVVRPTASLASPDADWAPTVVRLRRLDRFQHTIRRDGSLYGAFTQELFVNVHPASSRVAMLEQFRAQFLLGRQLSRHNRIEAGYGLQRFNRRGGYEVNHTLVMSFRTNAPIR